MILFISKTDSLLTCEKIKYEMFINFDYIIIAPEPIRR